jgi:hypothetical protein
MEFSDGLKLHHNELSSSEVKVAPVFNKQALSHEGVWEVEV